MIEILHLDGIGPVPLKPLTVVVGEDARAIELLKWTVEGEGLGWLNHPEVGIHPHCLGGIFKTLRSDAQQWVVYTCSPHLLDYVDLDVDQVLVTIGDQCSAPDIRPICRPRLANFLDDFKLGEVWFNQWEIGLVCMDSDCPCFLGGQG